LLRSFANSVRYATCSEPSDQTAIMGEIGDDVDRVDGTIRVLIRAKASTPLWNKLAERGIDVSDAGFTEWAFPTYTVVGLIVHCYKGFFRKKYALWETALKLGTAVITVLWCAVVVCLGTDRRAFCFQALQKAMVPYFFTHAATQLIEVFLNTKEMNKRR